MKSKQSDFVLKFFNKNGGALHTYERIKESQTLILFDHITVVGRPAYKH